MKMNKSTRISIRIIALFTVAIFVSFIPEYLHAFFGDWYCNGTGARELVPATQMTYEHYEYTGCDYYNGAKHMAMWHWGYRHWLLVCMGIGLAVVQIVNIINVIDKSESNEK